MDFGRRGFRLVGGDFVLRGRIAERVCKTQGGALWPPTAAGLFAARHQRFINLVSRRMFPGLAFGIAKS
jgi:hypothetical protein